MRLTKAANDNIRILSNNNTTVATAHWPLAIRIYENEEDGRWKTLSQYPSIQHIVEDHKHGTINISQRFNSILLR